jgi:hypothetical protein
MEERHPIERFGAWLLPRWPMLLIRGGFALFATACLGSVRLPLAALYVGPALMLAGCVLTVLARKAASSARRTTSSSSSPQAPDQHARSSR